MKNDFEQIFLSIVILFGVTVGIVGVLTGNLGGAISGLMVVIVGTSASSDVYMNKKIEELNKKFDELYKKLNKGDDLK